MNAGRIGQVGGAELYHSPDARPPALVAGNEWSRRREAPRLCLSGDLAFPVPAAREPRYRSHAGRGQLLLGLRPEHITEFRAQTSSNQVPFEYLVDVTEPMGMETLVFLRVNGSDICARTNPSAGAQPGVKLKMLADLDQMHLIDDASGLVL
jgi:multiple sugar transport system ATP-binding protein